MSVYAVGDEVIQNDVTFTVVGHHPTIDGMLRLYNVDSNVEHWAKDSTVIAVE